MPCYHPIVMYQAAAVNESGRRSFITNPHAAHTGIPHKIPCGRCIGCRLERSRQWAIRCMHEARRYDDNCFITLTYSDENLPLDCSLSLSDYQKFLKRLRKRSGKHIRFFGCGEYGETYGRPHYHILLFGFNFEDRKYLRAGSDGSIYRSSMLEELWPFGLSEIGNVTFESAAYVARYCVKKVNGDLADSHYGGRSPEFGTMSRRPGIGFAHLEEFVSNIFPNDFVVARGVKCKPPRYYHSKLEQIDLGMFERVNADREKAAYSDHTRQFANSRKPRLAVREEVAHARLGKRTLE